MKFAKLLLGSTAIPLMLLSANASALQPQTSAINVAQADTGDQPQQPPRTRPRLQDQDEGGTQRPPRRQERSGSDNDGGRQRPQRSGGQGGEAPDTPRPPRTGTDRDAPAAPRPAQEQRQPTERPAPTRQSPAPAERTRSQDEAPARPSRPNAQERDQRQGERPRQQAPSTPERPSAPSATTPAQPRSTPPAQRPAERPRQEQDQDQRRPQSAPTTQQRTTPEAPAQAPDSRTLRTQPAPTPSAPAQSAPAPTARPTPPPASAAPQQAAPQRAQPLDPSRVRIDDLRNQRRERRDGDRVIIEEPGNRTIIRQGNNVIIRHDESERFRRIYGADEVRVERRGPGEEVTVVRRPDGSEIVTIRDEDGNLIRRVRREPAGREVVLIENRRSGIGVRPGYGYVDEEVLRLPPPVVRIPRERYIVETERASEADIVEAFTAPPVERVERAYTLDEIRRSQPLRERMRRVDLDTINFEFGSWELPPDQTDALRVIADGLQQAISRNPNEIFLVEGHTDAVGSDEDNLTLSDRRAETVATILTQQFQIPAENLTTQGYGEQYLKVDSQGPEQANRRVTLRRITPLLQGQNQQ